MDNKPLTKTASFNHNTHPGNRSLLHFNYPEGTVIKDRFKIIKKIGEGGYGIVYLVNDTLSNTLVALKILSPEMAGNQDKIKEIQREIKISQKIVDKRIVRIFFLDQWEGIYFLVMEYIKGKTLTEFLSDHEKISWAVFQDIFMDILEGVNTLHQNQIIHRDLKPSNIIITENNSIKILDFGLSKEVSDGVVSQTIEGLRGTPQYMAPEQIYGKELSYNTDIYPLGLILYEALSGFHPFKENSKIEMLINQINEKHKRINSKDIKIPSYVEYIIDKSLQKDEKSRFQGIEEILTILKQKKVSSIKRLFILSPKNLLKKITIRILLVTILTLIILGFIGLTNSKKIHKYSFNGDTLLAKNRLGGTVWKKSIPGYKIFRIFTRPLQNGLGRQNFAKDNGIWTFLYNPDSSSFNPEESVYNINRDNRIMVFNSKGEIKKNRSQIEIIGLNMLDFSRSTYNPKIEEKDLDGDGQPELIYYTHHANGMFPSSFSILNKIGNFNYHHPGQIDSWSREKNKDSKKPKILLSGINNLLGHLRFFTFFDLDLKNPVSPLAVPSVFRNKKKTYTEFRVPENYIVFHREFVPVKIEWASKGMATFLNRQTSQRIIFRKDFSLEIHDSGTVKTYRDPPERLKNIYISVNKCFYQKWVTKNNSKALEYINEALRLPVENPYLISLLWYLKGDLEISLANYPKGKNSLLRAHRFNRYNDDVVHRLCEIPFLEERPDLALELSNQEFHTFNRFWGVHLGRELFNYYCHLSEGDFSRSVGSSLITTHARLVNFAFLESILHIFKGEYQKGLNLINKTFNLRFSTFTSQDLRFVSARLHLLGSQKTEPGYFYFKDLNQYSNFRKHLTKISLAYYTSFTQPLVAERLAKEGYKEVLQKAKGDFETRFWLFYEAYVYGLTMERLGNSKEAIRGYKKCIKANPHTHLAKEAGKKLDSLQ